MFDRSDRGSAPHPGAAGAGVPGGLAAAVAGADAAGARLDRVTALAPGPLQIGLLAAVDPDTLDHAGRVELLQAWERAARWVTGRQLGAVVAVAGPVATSRDDFAREDVRAALRQVGGSWRQDVDLARALAGPLTAAGAALAAGTLSYPQARALAQETEPLDPAAARAVCQRVLGDASTRTPADFGRRVRAAVIAVDPIGAALRAEQATDAPPGHPPEAARRAGRPGGHRPGHRDRRHLGRPDPPGRAHPPRRPAHPRPAPLRRTARHLPHRHHRHPAHQPHRPHRPRRSRRHRDRHRRRDRRRHDKPTGAADGQGTSTTGSSPTGGGPTGATGASGPAPGQGAARTGRRRDSRTGTTASVFVFADAATWAGLAEHPGDLDGYGPIPAGMARDCFTDAQWRAVVTDALTGLVASVSDDTYTPSARTRRHLFAQDRGCLFPGCPAPVWYCDADHSVPHDQGGCTDPDNCGLLCRRHHRLKTHTGWTWTRHPDGTVAWTSPDGHIWTREPQRYHHTPPSRGIADTPTDAGPPSTTDPHTGPAPTRAGPDTTGTVDVPPY